MLNLLSPKNFYHFFSWRHGIVIGKLIIGIIKKIIGMLWNTGIGTDWMNWNIMQDRQKFDLAEPTGLYQIWCVDDFKESF